MEILIGVLLGTTIFIIAYRKQIEKLTRLQYIIKFLKGMDAKTEDRIWQKLEKMDDEITDIKVAVGQMKVKLALYASVFSVLGSVIVWAVKVYVFKA